MWLQVLTDLSRKSQGELTMQNAPVMQVHHPVGNFQDALAYTDLQGSLLCTVSSFL